MTNRQRRSLAKYIAGVAVEIGLRDWTLRFEAAPCEDPALATVQTVYGRKIANVRVAADFSDYSPEEQRNAIVHELIHVHFAQQNQAVADALDVLGHEAQTVAAAAYRVGHEYGVDGLAYAIAPNYPLWEGQR